MKTGGQGGIRDEGLLESGAMPSLSALSSIGFLFSSMTTRRYGGSSALPPEKSTTIHSKIGFALRLAKKAISLLFVMVRAGMRQSR